MGLKGGKGWRLAALVAAGVALAAAAPEVTFFSGHVNGQVEGFEKLDVKMFQARPLPSKLYTEVWFHEMQFREPGIIVIVNVQMHNLGVSSGYCDSYITVSSPELGYVGDFSSSSPEEVKIDPEGFGISTGAARLELRAGVYRVRFTGKDIQGDFTYTPLVGSYQQGDGMVRFTKSDEFVRHNFPIPWARISGRLTVKGKTRELAGVGSLNHDWQQLSPLRYMSEWRAFWFYTDDATVSMVRASAPDLDGRWSERLMVAEPGRILFSSHDYTLTELDPAAAPEGGVMLPRRFRVEARAGDDWLTGEIKVTRVAESKNVLAEYPYLFRKLAEMVADETWSYRFWCDFKFEFHEDGETRSIAGTGTGNFVNSVKAK
ncbi:MAG TPA: hypothetical protein VM658_12690 [bacterium]|nr:hypothetical protein [bacterium]